MKWIVYNKENVVLNDDGEVENQSFIPIHSPYSYENENIAKSEAYNGEYTIEDDGQPEPELEPTQLDRVEAQSTYTAMMTDTLLEV